MKFHRNIMSLSTELSKIAIKGTFAASVECFKNIFAKMLSKYCPNFSIFPLGHKQIESNF